VRLSTSQVARATRGLRTATGQGAAAVLINLTAHKQGNRSAKTEGNMRPLTTLEPTPEQRCSGADYVWVLLNTQSIDKWGRVAIIYTRGKTKMDYDWSNTEESEVDMTANIGPSGALLPIGLSHSVQTAAGVNFSAGAFNLKNLEVGWAYYAYHLQCQTPQRKWYPGYYRWIPHHFTGGNRITQSTASFSCNENFKITISSPVWVSRSVSNTFKGGVDWIGFSANSRQVNTNEHKMTISPLNGKTATICGSNNHPTRALRIREDA
jgi:hypothetical protein